MIGGIDVRKKIIILACTLLLVSLQIGNQFQVAYATVFIDCPDCNNGHSPSCRCGGAVDFLQPCDLCGGSGTLACDLCGGTGLSDGGTCTRCGGDLLSTCNRCGGAGSTVQPCFKPSCARCGGTGGYPEGSPEHIQQLKDEGKYVEPVTETTDPKETGEISTEEIDSKESQTKETEQKSGESPDNRNASIKETDLVTAYELLRSATSSEKSKKENIVISETMTVALKNATEEQLQVLSNLTQEEFTNSMNQVAQIVDTVKTGTVSASSKQLIENLENQEGVQIGLISFDEHESISLGFPVEIRVPVNGDEYGNMEKAYAYHVIQDGLKAEYLGEAELIRDDNGNVTEVLFITEGFSDFFITNIQVNMEEITVENVKNQDVQDLEQEEVEESDVVTTGIDKVEESNNITVYFVTGAVVVIGVVAVALFVINRKKTK